MKRMKHPNIVMLKEVCLHACSVRTRCERTCAQAGGPHVCASSRRSKAICRACARLQASGALLFCEHQLDAFCGTAREPLSEHERLCSLLSFPCPALPWQSGKEGRSASTGFRAPCQHHARSVRSHGHAHPTRANLAALLQRWQPTSSLHHLHSSGPKHQHSIKQGWCCWQPAHQTEHTIDAAPVTQP